MNHLGTCLAVVLLARYVGGVDTTETGVPTTVIDLLVGAGSYAEVTRDCNGNVKSVRDIPYTEFGLSASHTFSSFKVGISAGVTNAARTATNLSSNIGTDAHLPYVAPQIGLNTKYIGLDVGYLFDLSTTTRPPSDYGYYPLVERENGGTAIGGLRIGRLDGTYFSASYGMNNPISVGSGVFDMGLGFGSPATRLWLGLGAVPDDGLMVAGKGEFAVSDHLSVCVRSHIAPGDGFGYGVAGGMKIQF